MIKKKLTVIIFFIILILTFVFLYVEYFSEPEYIKIYIQPFSIRGVKSIDKKILNDIVVFLKSRHKTDCLILNNKDDIDRYTITIFFKRNDKSKSNISAVVSFDKNERKFEIDASSELETIDKKIEILTWLNEKIEPLLLKIKNTDAVKQAEINNISYDFHSISELKIFDELKQFEKQIYQSPQKTELYFKIAKKIIVASLPVVFDTKRAMLMYAQAFNNNGLLLDKENKYTNDFLLNRALILFYLGQQNNALTDIEKLLSDTFVLTDDIYNEARALELTIKFQPLELKEIYENQKHNKLIARLFFYSLEECGLIGTRDKVYKELLNDDPMIMNICLRVGANAPVSTAHRFTVENMFKSIFISKKILTDYFELPEMEQSISTEKFDLRNIMRRLALAKKDKTTNENQLAAEYIKEYLELKKKINSVKPRKSVVISKQTFFDYCDDIINEAFKSRYVFVMKKWGVPKYAKEFADYLRTNVPDYYFGLILEGSYLNYLNKSNQAIGNYEEYLKKTKNNNNYLTIKNILVNVSSKQTKFINDLNYKLNIENNSWMLNDYISNFYLPKRWYGGARELAEISMKYNPYSFYAHYAYARATRNYREYMDSIANKMSGNFDYHNTMLRRDLNRYIKDKKSLQKTLDFIDALIEKMPDELNLYNLKSVIFSRLGDERKSIDYLYKTLEYNKEPFRAIVIKDRIGAKYLKIGELAKAYEIFKETAKSYKASSLHGLAECYIRMHKDDEAEKILLASAERYIDGAYSPMQLFKFYYDRRKLNKADDFFYKFIDDDNSNRWAEKCSTYFRKVINDAEMRKKYFAFIDRYLPDIDNVRVMQNRFWAALLDEDINSAEKQLSIIERKTKNAFVFDYIRLILGYKKNDDELIDKCLKNMSEMSGKTNFYYSVYPKVISGEITAEKAENMYLDKWFYDNYKCRLFTILGYESLRNNLKEDACEYFRRALEGIVNTSSLRYMARYELQRLGETNEDEDEDEE